MTSDKARRRSGRPRCYAEACERAAARGGTGGNVYCDVNFRTKKALREAVAAGREVGIWQPGPFGGAEPRDGEVSVEGPHAPEAHKWYSRVTLAGGRIVRVK